MKTKIVVSLGPASDSLEQLERLYHAGMRIARLNFSHGIHSWAKEVVGHIRTLNKKVPFPVGIMLDTKGPEIRSQVTQEPISIGLRQTIGFYFEEKKPKLIPGVQGIGVDYKDIAKDIGKGQKILLDGGVITLKVIEVNKGVVYAKALQQGTIGSRRHVTLPGVPIRLPALTEKDKKDITFGLRLGVDFVAYSFVRTEKEVEELRSFMKQRKKGMLPGIIAKIETHEAMNNLDEIVEASDGVMVARGDLAVEEPFEKLPLLQKDIVDTARFLRKPVIMATQMMESMIENPMPTRAEISDVGHAVADEVDGIMLSGETTVGKYPVECVAAMASIAKEIEKQNSAVPMLWSGGDTNEKIAESAVLLAHTVHTDALVVITDQRSHVEHVSGSRGGRPLLVLTTNKQLLGQCSLYHGVFAPSLEKLPKTKKALLQKIKKMLIEYKIAKKPQSVVLLRDKYLHDDILDTIELVTLS